MVRTSFTQLESLEPFQVVGMNARESLLEIMPIVFPSQSYISVTAVAGFAALCMDPAAIPVRNAWQRLHSYKNSILHRAFLARLCADARRRYPPFVVRSSAAPRTPVTLRCRRLNDPRYDESHVPSSEHRMRSSAVPPHTYIVRGTCQQQSACSRPGPQRIDASPSQLRTWVNSSLSAL